MDRLNNLKKALYSVLGVKPTPVFLTVKQIRKIMKNGDDMPTAIFSTDKKDYIVKARTIYSKKKTKSLIKF